jgi:two-component system cell cycle sensor histidine kinase/response regulator CckA
LSASPLKRTKRPATGNTRRAPSIEKVPAALLALALRAQSEGVLVARCDQAGAQPRILFANDSLCAMTGRRPARLQGSPLSVLHVDRTDIERLQDWIADARAGDSLQGEGYLSRAGGGSLVASWNYDAMGDRRGKISHVVATFRDTTERRRQQESAEHALRLDAVGRLAGGVAHDFNNLISVVTGYCQILAAEISSSHPQLRHQVEEIHKAGQKAADLTRQLLAFGRRQPMNPLVINLNGVVRENSAILERLLGDRGKLELRLDPELGNVRADPGQLQQVLLNLVLNARDALRRPGKVVIRTENRDLKANRSRRFASVPPGRYVALCVTDSGMGMDGETLAHIFEPFFTTKEEGKGSGLGLPLVYGVVQQSGGHIAVESRLLIGSTFEILLPRVDAPVQAPSRPKLPTLPMTRGSESVMLIESDAVVRKMVAGILASDGYRVESVADTRRALALLRRRKDFQLAIASLSPSDPAAASFVVRLTELCPGIRLLNTGSADPFTAPRLPQLNLPKPFALSEVLRAVRSLLNMRPRQRR